MVILTEVNKGAVSITGPVLRRTAAAKPVRDAAQNPAVVLSLRAALVARQMRNSDFK
jgi:hypothetical protein